MKYIVVTGWVMSGTGKWIVAASIGVLLKQSGVAVDIIKCDPYLQIDAGTMSPYEHGEVFVTHDGGEVDLDFGHYERFLSQGVSRNNAITTGQIYADVIARERKGDYLGQTVQVVPHIVDEVKARIETVATHLTQKQQSDRHAVIIEIGGTVWDMEWPHFFEAMRQLRAQYSHDVCFVHVAPLVRHSHSGEVKTKPLQHSIQRLREIGIIPDMVICRTPADVHDIPRRKIALMTGIREEYCIHGIDCDTVYAVPLGFAKQGVDTMLYDHFHRPKIWSERADLNVWQQKIDALRATKNISPKEQKNGDRIDNHSIDHDVNQFVNQRVNIALAGKYTHLEDCYLSVIEALKHASRSCGKTLQIQWLDTEKSAKRSEEEMQQRWEDHDIQGVIVPWGFGERWVEWMIMVADYCKRYNIPYLGICLGMQVAVIAHARRQGLDAHSAEFETSHTDKVIALMDSQASVVDKGGTMRLGSYDAVLTPGSRVAELYGREQVSERHRHRYEVNPSYHDMLQKTGLTLSWMSPDGHLVECIEYQDHPYFVATQAHPEFCSTFSQPHPLFVGLIEHASTA